MKRIENHRSSSLFTPNSYPITVQYRDVNGDGRHLDCLPTGSEDKAQRFVLISHGALDSNACPHGIIAAAQSAASCTIKGAE